LDEYKEQFQKLIDEFKTKTDLFSPKKTRILLLGDIVDSKTSISPECNLQVGWLLNELNKIAKTIVICGNHDVGNLERMDSITPIFALSNFTNSLYLDKELSYHSGCFVDENIVWCLYSIFDGFQRPNIDEMKIKYPDKTFIGLIHGDVIGAKTDLGRKVDTGLGVSNFDGLDYVLCGHIHKYQNINKSGIPILYCGSTLQNNFGENINGHGFVIVDIENKNHELIEIPSDYGYYKFVINSELDIENDLEKLTNF
jgi:DNA repair exonuclease SbcCD nuclease subunit